MLSRLFKHLFFPAWRLRRAFPPHTLSAIEQAVKDSERSHLGEIRFAVEIALEPSALWHRQTARGRALEVFSQLRVWDTELNNGVLMYIQLADRDVEIVADRGIARRVSNDEWQAICLTMEQAFGRGDFAGGSLAGIDAVSTLLARHFPAGGKNLNELPDKPYVR
jgi:uncharacterized membrane protein